MESVAIADCDEGTLAEVTSLINRANADRRGPFVGDRLQPDTLGDHYRECELLILRRGSAAIATFAHRAKEAGLWVYILAVDPAHKGQGYGERMLREADRIARDRSLEILVLEAVDVGRLVAYYERLGFSQVSRVRCEKGHWGSTEPFDLVRLSRPV